MQRLALGLRNGEAGDSFDMKESPASVNCGLLMHTQSATDSYCTRKMPQIPPSNWKDWNVR